jgi:phosphatidylinositol-3-phosphatase
MSYVRCIRYVGALALLIALGNMNVSAQGVKKVFVIAMENHNWTQPNNQFTGGIQQIFQNPAAPFINSMVSGSAFATVNGRGIHVSSQVSYATNYHNVLATPSGNNPHIHPSEPNYIWAEAGTNFGVLNDNEPFAATNPSNQNSTAHLATLLTKAGKTWKSYQEDIDLAVDPTTGKLTNNALPQHQWTVPLKNLSGTFAPGYTNVFNGSNQYNYAAKHNPMVFFTDSNGGNDLTPSNPLSQHYAPFQQFYSDLVNGKTADYNFITPNQFNDMHTTLTGGYKGLTGDPAKILQGDDFIRYFVPMIMSTQAYKDNGAIVIWFDESEGDGVTGDNPDDFSHTIGEIVISPLAHANVNGLPYGSSVVMTHSSDLKTMQEIFQVGPLLGDAVNANDLSDLFAPGTIPTLP